MDLSSLNSLNGYSGVTDSTSLAQTQFVDESAKLESFQDALLMAQDDEELKNACEQFEQYFINLMFKEMQKTVLKDNSENSMFKESQAEGIYKDFLYQEYAKGMTEAGGIGLAQQMYEQMQRQNQGKITAEELMSQSQNESQSIE